MSLPNLTARSLALAEKNDIAMAPNQKLSVKGIILMVFFFWVKNTLFQRRSALNEKVLRHLLYKFFKIIISN